MSILASIKTAFARRKAEQAETLEGLAEQIARDEFGGQPQEVVEILTRLDSTPEHLAAPVETALERRRLRQQIADAVGTEERMAAIDQTIRTEAESFAKVEAQYQATINQLSAEREECSRRRMTAKAAERHLLSNAASQDLRRRIGAWQTHNTSLVSRKQQLVRQLEGDEQLKRVQAERRHRDLTGEAFTTAVQAALAKPSEHVAGLRAELADLDAEIADHSRAWELLRAEAPQ